MAVGSRTTERAEVFGKDLNVPNRHGRYADLVADPDVDVVYVATPTSAHRENVLLCLAARKAVLCEKPFTVDAAEARDVVAAARRAGVFVMEAMWTRFLPIMANLRALLRDGAIGDVRYLMADFGTPLGSEPQARLVDPELGGGALLQKGIYLLSLASLLFGRPTRVTGLNGLMGSGADDEAAVILGYEGGQLALLLTSLRARTSREATIMGTAGRIRIEAPVIAPSRLTVSSTVPKGDRGPRDRSRGRLKTRLFEYGQHSALIRGLRERYSALGDWVVYGDRRRVIRAPFLGGGLQYQAAEVMRCLRAGLTESSAMCLDESVAVMETTDRLRAFRPG